LRNMQPNEWVMPFACGGDSAESFVADGFPRVVPVGIQHDQNRHGSDGAILERARPRGGQTCALARKPATELA
jgi:hypothetical protein